MKKPKPPKTFQEVEDYIVEKMLLVEPEFFWEFFEAAEWYDSRGNPVLSWRQKLLTWHRKALEQGGRAHKCSIGGCKLPGVYVAGRDDSGQPYWRCIKHKPIFRQSMTDMTSALKFVEDPRVNVNNRRNELMKDLN